MIDTSRVRNALVRARLLINDLDRTANTGDLAQVRAGIKHELEAALSALRDLRAESPAEPAKTPEVPAEGQERLMLIYVMQLNREDAFPTDLTLQRMMELQPAEQRAIRGWLGDRGLIAPAGVTTEEGENWTQWEATAPGRKVARKLLGEDPQVRPEKPGEQTSIMDL